MNSQNSVTEKHLLEIAAGDMSGLERLYELMAKQLYAFILSIVGSREPAEDILHDAFLRIGTCAHMYKKGTNARAWVFTIAKNLSFTYISRNKRELLPIDELEIIDSHSHSNETENKALAETALSALNKGEHQVVTLYITAGLKHREIADILGLPLGTVLWRYSNALKKMKAKLNGWEGE